MEDDVRTRPPAPLLALAVVGGLTLVGAVLLAAVQPTETGERFTDSDTPSSTLTVSAGGSSTGLSGASASSGGASRSGAVEAVLPTVVDGIHIDAARLDLERVTALSGSRNMDATDVLAVLAAGRGNADEAVVISAAGSSHDGRRVTILAVTVRRNDVDRVARAVAGTTRGTDERNARGELLTAVVRRGATVYLVSASDDALLDSTLEALKE